MSPTPSSTVSRDEARRLGHEPDRVRTGLIIGMAVLLAVIVALVQLSVHLFMGRVGRPPTPPRQVTERAREQLAGADHWAIQPLDREALERAEDSHLTGYAWVDRDAGVVRIPLQRAMELEAAAHAGRQAAGETP